MSLKRNKMFEKFIIKNFKSITELELDLGQVNVIIGANSIVTKNIPNNCIAAGNPCKIIKENQ